MTVKPYLKLILLSFLVNIAWASEWVIGLDADMSNVAKAGGKAIEQGLQIAVDEINAAGGVLGKPIVIEVHDHRGNPARGIANLRNLHENENLIAVVGGVHTPVAIAELPFIHKAPLIYLDPWAAGTPVIDNGYEPNFAFRLSVRDEWAGQVILAEAKADLCSSITLLLERTGWGRSNETSMKQAATQLGLTIDGVEWFNWNSEIFSELIQALAKEGAECLALVANAPESAEIVRAIAQLPESQRPSVYSHWGITGGDFEMLVEPEVLNKVKLKHLQTLSYHQPKTKKGEKLVVNFEKIFGPQAANNAFNGVAHAYDLVHLLALAITQAGSIEPNGVRLALENIARFDGAMKKYEFPFSKQNHEALNAEDYIMLELKPQGQAKND